MCRFPGWKVTWKTAHSERFQNPALVMREAKWTDTSSTRVVRDGFGTREKHREHMQVMAEEYELPLPPCTYICSLALRCRWRFVDHFADDPCPCPHPVDNSDDIHPDDIQTITAPSAGRAGSTFSWHIQLAKSAGTVSQLPTPKAGAALVARKYELFNSRATSWSPSSNVRDAACPSRCGPEGSSSPR